VNNIEPLRFYQLEGKVRDLGEEVERLKNQIIAGLKLPDDVVLAESKRTSKAAIEEVQLQGLKNKISKMNHTV